MATVDDLLYYLRSVIGAPYLWYEGYEGQWYGPPEYMDATDWTADWVLSEGINCSGLFNWGLQQVGYNGVGGTEHYYALATEPIDPNWQATYSPGQFVITMSGAQGHMAMVSGPDNLLIQADTYYNYVNEERYLWDQQYWLDQEGLAFTWVGRML
jgi:cell wall-associated NlpC family hydrolase